MRLAFAFVAALVATPAAAASSYDYDTLGAEFCRLSTAGDLAGLRPLLSRELAAALDAAARSPMLPPPQALFQTYTNAMPVCAARTRNAALVEITRSRAPGAGPAWIEYLVVVPEADGTDRIDDVLFATRRSDTLKARLAAFAAAGH